VELQAISGYLSRQRNVHDRPRLFAWLASRDFGAQLLHGRRNSSRQNTCVDVQAGVSPGSNHHSTTPLLGGNAPLRNPSSASVTANQMLWQSILTTLQRDVAPEEFATWLGDTTLLDVDHVRQMVVVGTPHVFARDVVQQQYLPTLSAALSAQLHQAYTLTVVVGSG
jgi:hypothetical protein